MTATLEDLLVGKAAPVTTTADEPLQKAIELMVQHDYSQIPVVDNAGSPKALLTSDSIVRALNNFEVAPTALRVGDAMHERFNRSPADVDLLDVLDDLKNYGAILVVDAQKLLVGIVTTYDTTEYFRLRSQDIMLVQDIEETIKEYVGAPFKTTQDVVDTSLLEVAIEDITPSNSKELRGPFVKALEGYLKLRGDPTPAVDGKLAVQAFEEHLYRRAEVKPFDRLTLNEYIELFLHKSRWSTYSPVLRIDREALHKLLSRVRKTRNELAHFRSEISEQQREELRFCRDWLGRQEESIEAAFTPRSPLVVQPALTAPIIVPPEPAVSSDAAESRPPIDEESRPADSRYIELAQWLQMQPPAVEQVALPFAEVEKLIGDRLPWSAREHRSWWANDSTRHVQSKLWLHAGWRVTNVNPHGEMVVFARNKEREQAYNLFFASIIEALRKTDGFVVAGTPTGNSWLTISPMPSAELRVGYLNLSFARTKQLRIELYIDSSDSAKNKRVFDSLYRNKEAIHADLGENISWERIDKGRASRIAIYYAGTITDDEGSLADLREKAVPAVVRFRRVMSDYLLRVLEEKPT